MQTGLPFFRLLHIATSLPALAPVSNVSKSMRGAQDPESDSRELLDEVRGWPGGKSMGTVTHVSTKNRNRWWEVSCLFSSLKTRAKAVRIYSACHLKSEDRALLHAAAFEECVQYHTVSKFNEWFKAKSIKVSPTPGDQATEQDISERMDRGFVTEPQAEQTASHGAFKSAGLQPASDILEGMVAPAADEGAGAARVWAEMEQPAASLVTFWRLVGAGVGVATISTRYIWRSEQQALSHKEAFLLSIQAYGDSENFEAAVCKAQSQPIAEQAVPFTNTGANYDIELSLWKRGKSLGMVTHISKQGESSREDQPEVVTVPPLAQAGGADMEACMPDAPLRANAHN